MARRAGADPETSRSSRRLGPGLRHDTEDQLVLAEGRPLLDPRCQNQLAVGRRHELAARDGALEVPGLRPFSCSHFASLASTSARAFSTSLFSSLVVFSFVYFSSTTFLFTACS